MTDQDDADDEEEDREKHAIQGGTEFVEKLLTGDTDSDEEDEDDE